MSEISYKKSLNNAVNETGIEGEGFLPGRCPAKEGPSIGYRKRMYQYWKDCLSRKNKTYHVRLGVF